MNGFPRFPRRHTFLTLVVLSALATMPVLAQVPTLTVNSAAITINPSATDSYDVKGTFSGLSFNNVSVVSFAVGNFSATISFSSFAQQPGTRVYVYQDTTGQSQAWFSTLSIDLDAQTFEAQANGIVLAGLSNPFAAQLGVDTGSACSMVRVQSVSPGSYQLTPGDPQGMTCELSTLPTFVPDVVPTNTPTNVNIGLIPTLFTGTDVPVNLQLFQTDDNAQPVGDPLCNLTAQPDGSYACSVLFNQPTAGMIPLVVQATVGGQPVLATGFAVEAVDPPTDDDVQQISDIESAMLASWSNFSQYGDTAHARVQSLTALRTLLSPPVNLTAQPLGLAADGLSIYVRSHSGLPMVLPLNDVADLLAGQAAAPGASASRASDSARFGESGGENSARENAAPSTAPPTLQCGNFSRDVIGSNRVMVWSPGNIFGFRVYKEMVNVLMASKCPVFQIDPPLIAENATIASLTQFSNYNTIIMNSHGARDHERRFVISGDESFRGKMDLATALGIEGTACPPEGCFKTVYPNHPNLHALKNSLIYGGFCYSFEGILESFRNTFAPVGTNSTYFGYYGPSPCSDDHTYGVPLLNGLVNQYWATGQTYDSILAVTGSIRSSSTKVAPALVCLECTLPLVTPLHFGLWNDRNLAYVGNPQLTAPGTLPYIDPMLSTLNLQAQLDGTASCMGGMNLMWTNTATGGHLVPGDGSGGQDNFTTTSLSAGYTASVLLPAPAILPSDNITVTFLPDPSNPPAAMACTQVLVGLPDQVLHIAFSGLGQSSYTTSNDYNGTANLTWQESWNMHIPFFQDLQPTYNGNYETLVQTPLAGVSVTGTTTVKSLIAGGSCTGPPVMSGISGAPLAGVGAINFGAPIPYPTVSMFVETFGGGVYHLCDGNAVIGIGDQVQGYPGFDPAPQLFLFNLDLSKFLGKTTTMSMPVSGTFQPGPDDPNKGTVTYSGMLTFSTAPTTASSVRMKK